MTAVYMLLRLDKMEINIIEENVNALFSRREVKVEVSSETIPSNEEAKRIIADKFSVNEDVVRIRKIDTKFGSQSFLIIADVYDSKEEFLRVVKKTKQEIEAEKKAEEERLKAEAEAKEAEKAAKAKAEKPAEEVKEEAPAEEKTE